MALAYIKNRNRGCSAVIDFTACPEPVSPGMEGGVKWKKTNLSVESATKKYAGNDVKLEAKTGVLVVETPTRSIVINAVTITRDQKWK